jgi:hypothetical protein
VDKQVVNDNRDVLKRAQTALENIADWEKRHGKGINLVPIITDLVAEVCDGSRTIRGLRTSLQAMAEDYQDLNAENVDLRHENARLQGRVDVLQEQWDRLPTSGAQL